MVLFFLLSMSCPLWTRTWTSKQHSKSLDFVHARKRNCTIIMNSPSSQFWVQGCFRLAAKEARKLINCQPLHVLLQTTTMQKSFPLCHWVMSAITTITLVATIAINIFIIRFTVFTTPDVALAVILLLCPTNCCLV